MRLRLKLFYFVKTAPASFVKLRKVLNQRNTFFDLTQKIDLRSISYEVS